MEGPGNPRQAGWGGGPASSDEVRTMREAGNLFLSWGGDGQRGFSYPTSTSLLTGSQKGPDLSQRWGQPGNCK